MKFMIVNHRFKFVIFHVPKTGGTSIRHLYRNIRGNDRGIMGSAHMTCREFVQNYKKEPMGKYPRYAIKRNPFDRLVSAYQHIVQRTQHHNEAKQPFKKFVASLENEGEWGRERLRNSSVLWPQHHFTESPDDIKVILLPFEHFGESATEVARHFGFYPLLENPIPHRNASAKLDIEWDEPSREVVRRVYARDFSYLGYDKGSGRCA
jgi:hypothetical protein